MPAWTRSNKHFLNCRYGLYLCTPKCMHVIQAGLKAKGFMWYLSPGSLFSIPICAGGIGWNETSLQVTQWSSLSAKGIWVLRVVRLCSPLLQHQGSRKLKFSRPPSGISWWSCAACTLQRAHHLAEVITHFSASSHSGEQAVPVLSVISVKSNYIWPFHCDETKVHATVPAHTPPVKQGGSSARGLSPLFGILTSVWSNLAGGLGPLTALLPMADPPERMMLGMLQLPTFP